MLIQADLIAGLNQLWNGREWAFGGDGKIYEKAKQEIDAAVTKGKVDELKLLVAFEHIIGEIAAKK